MKSHATARRIRVVNDEASSADFPIDSSMSDDLFDSPYPTSMLQERRPPEELLYVFVRLRDRAPMSCLLRSTGAASDWEVQFMVRGALAASRRAFATRALAVQWAEEQRKTMESGAVGCC